MPPASRTAAKKRGGELPKLPDDAFTDLLTRLVRVPKEAIVKQEREYQKAKKKGPAKRGQIVTTGKKAG